MRLAEEGFLPAISAPLPELSPQSASARSISTVSASFHRILPGKGRAPVSQSLWNPSHLCGLRMALPMAMASSKNKPIASRWKAEPQPGPKGGELRGCSKSQERTILPKFSCRTLLFKLSCHGACAGQNQLGLGRDEDRASMSSGGAAFIGHEPHSCGDQGTPQGLNLDFGRGALALTGLARA